MSDCTGFETLTISSTAFEDVELLHLSKTVKLLGKSDDTLPGSKYSRSQALNMTNLSHRKPRF